MGKAGGVIVSICGVILLLFGLLLLYGLFLDNTIMLVAAPMLILDFMIFAAAIFLIVKGYQSFARAVDKENEVHI